MSKKKLTNEELMDIFSAIQEAYAQAGKKIQTAVLFDEDNPDGEIIHDERKEGDMN